MHDGTFRVEVEHPERGAARFLFYAADGTRLLPTGDQRLAEETRLHHALHRTESTRPTTYPHGGVTAVTQFHDSPLKPIDAQTRPDCDHICRYLVGQRRRE